MDKLQIQQRVSQNGKPLGLDKFEWDEKARVFSTTEANLVLDFAGEYGCTFKTGYGCTFKTGSGCTFTTGSGCTFTTWYGCTFTTGSGCTFTTWYGCTFTTGSGCTFKTGSDCTFKTEYGCTFTTGSRCVIINNNVFEVIQPKEGQVIQTCPYEIAGHLVDGNLDGVPHIIADKILSRIISQKGNVYKVINHGEKKQSYLIKQGDTYSHGKTLKEAKDSLVYKIGSRDTSVYKNLTLDSVLSKEECIKAYRTITGACESGTKYFVENQKKVKKNYSIKEIIEATKGQFGNEQFKQFFLVS